jgi:hypothetical protein
MASKSQSKSTTDHDEIRQWADASGGSPAVVQSTGGKGEDTGILRIDFPRYSGSDSLEEISWDEFFEKFDREKLALLYQETTARGQKSNFNKIVSRETLRSGARSRSGSRKSAGRALSDSGRNRSSTAAKNSARKTPREGTAARAGVRAPPTPRRESRPAVKRLNAAREAVKIHHQRNSVPRSTPAGVLATVSPSAPWLLICARPMKV